ncbi:NAD(P)/FAD-dependent oxidoreductase [Neolewinella antarctica]|uniref:Glycine/D-amino acid oxidase-like deaminating enzyme n=1 Tax=Neolewinella antarctica TaxID=442734 RepID=A0ABX0XBY0_9BACT|nr:FAD-binding oxidoreductase [Neolewinella antarctica]NJC26585.1 glycine/D-amino acid oxidase-like deaminating enzyme [Neolewinella antarctica]
MDILIVGQGLAGTVTGFRLEAAGHTVHYVDAPEQTAASSVAAGIVNPITGRRFVKSWLIDELIPETIDLYGRMGKLLGHKYWHPQPLIRTLYNRGDLNDWEVRSADAGYAEYMEDQPAPGRITEITEPVFAYAGVKHAGRVDVKNLVADYRIKLITEQRYFGLAFDYTTVPALLGDGTTTNLPNGMLPTYDRIIFCEGWRGRYNPYFADLGHGGNKGEVLFVRTEAKQLDRMFKHRVFLVPVEDDLYWVGATSEHQFADDQPSEENRTFLEDRLREVLTVPYVIESHEAAVRPTSRDRRMMIGTHATEPRLAVLNGLGTKGASLAPMGSKWLVAHLLEGAEIPVEVGIERFLDK